MQYMNLTIGEREELLDSLASMPGYVRDVFAHLHPEQARARGPNDMFSPVEQVWHLADLEREGFGERIRRLLSESEPHLPDFDGTQVAISRNYRTLSLEEGLRVFTEARQRNIGVLRELTSESWLRTGTQEGVGRVSVCDMPSFMFQHDRAHKAEIEEWKGI